MPQAAKEKRMTLAEQLRTKYALTSFKPKAACMVMLGINEALETAAEIADQEHSPVAASRIRSLKWMESGIASGSVPGFLPIAKRA
jgi:hypothetical protein